MLRTGKCWIIITTCALALLAPTQSRSDDGEPRLEAKARWDRRSPMKLSFEVILRGAEAVEVREASLPWGNHYGLILEAVMLPRGLSLEKFWPIDDPMDTMIKIRPGERLTGDVDLARRFKGAEGVMGQKDVLLFWSFQAEGRDGALPRVGGWVFARTQE